MAYIFPGPDELKCTRCQKIKPWYFFKSQFDKKTCARSTKVGVCTTCQMKEQTIKIKIVIRMADNKNMSDLRNKLFECLTDIQDRKINVQEAKAICEVAQTIISSVKVEVEYMKVIGGKKAGSFMAIEDALITE